MNTDDGLNLAIETAKHVLQDKENENFCLAPYYSRLLSEQFLAAMEKIEELERQRDGVGEIIPCYFCGSEVPTAEFSSDRKTGDLCVFCASTLTSPIDPTQRGNICSVANILLSEIKSLLREEK
jgi:hypothetical protein